jgi:hypothetical protein
VKRKRAKRNATPKATMIPKFWGKCVRKSKCQGG